MLDFLFMLGLSFLCVISLMLILWAIYLAQRNVGIIDIGWGIGFILCEIVYFVLGEGYFWRRFLILLIVSIWAIRLIAHLVQRYNPNQTDPRYQTMIETWNRNINLKVLALFLLQGLLVVVLSVPFLLMSQNFLPFFSTTEIFGLLLWMCGLVGETFADRQLYAFQRVPGNEHQVCEIGLWKYSRHPNYFFEWVIWIAYFVMAMSAPFGWAAIISPILMLYLLLKVSGVPLAEQQSLKTKGDAYRSYQKRTSVFFPWFK